MSLQASEDMIYAGDASRSVHFVRYSGRPVAPTDVPLVVVADDLLPRHITSVALWDKNAVVAADKFGSVFVLRFPPSVCGAVPSLAGSAPCLWMLRCSM